MTIIYIILKRCHIVHSEEFDVHFDQETYYPYKLGVRHACVIFFILLLLRWYLFGLTNLAICKEKLYILMIRILFEMMQLAVESRTTSDS